MFIINPDPYSMPTYRIGPFRTCDLSMNHLLPVSNLIDDYFKERFKGSDYIYTINGRSAINLALSHYNLKKDDVVTILTTTGNFYISSCVTNEISKFCHWSRDIVPGTKVLFVNHEFGYPYNDIIKLKETNLPIIEDCASSFFSNDRDNSIGRSGDFAIYSFPKMFPIQIGGLLVSNCGKIRQVSGEVSSELLCYVKNVLSEYIKNQGIIVAKRIENYRILQNLFESLGFEERFELIDGIVPGVFMFRTGNYKIDLPDLKKFFWAHGVQSSVFYGEEAFFIPVHQALNEPDLLYLYEVMNAYIQRVQQ